MAPLPSRGLEPLGSLTLVALLVLLVATAPVTAGTVGTAGTVETTETRTLAERPATDLRFTAPAATTGDDAGVEMTRTVHRTPDDPATVDVTVEFRLGSDARDLVVLADGRSEIRRSDGFDRVADGRFRWDRRTDDPSVRLTIPSNVTNGRFGGVDFVETADWGLVRPYTTAAYWSTASQGWEYAGVGRRYEITNRVAGEGYAGARFSYLGPHERHAVTVDGRTFTVVVPEPVADRVNGTRVLDGLRFADRALDADAGSSRLNVFVAPPPIRNGGLTNGAVHDGEQDLWVAAASADYRIPIHEYVHTRQSFGTTERTRWLTEATATFYGWSYAVRAGGADVGGFEREMASAKFEDAVLADRGAWKPAPVDYRKGARVVAALDDRIRRATGGERSFDDVFHRLNARDGPLTHAAFRRVVSDVAGTSLDAWIDRYVTTGASPAYPDDLNASYYVPGAGDPDGDGLATAAERASGTDPFAADTDGDGLDDGREVELGTDPTAVDSDGDCLDDGRERGLGTDPTAADTDGDGLDDGAELALGADPTAADSDGDGVRDGTEHDLGTDPTSADSDGDGLLDARERALGTDPTAESGVLDYWLAVVRNLF